MNSSDNVIKPCEYCIGNQKVKDILDNLWEEALSSSSFNKDEKEILNRRYQIGRRLPKNTLLFIGINPSFIDLPQENGVYYTNENYPYFNVYKTISKIVYPDNDFAYLDIFMLRETSQDVVIKMMGRHKPFFDGQKEISLKLIEAESPKAIVIANAYLSKLFVQNFNDKAFDESIGTYRINGGKLNGVPVFCSGMLSQARALDVHSRARLIWQIKKALNLTYDYDKDSMLNL